MKTLPLLIAAALLAATGCGRVDHRSMLAPSRAISLGANVEQDRPYTVLKKFVEKDRVYYFVHWLPLNEANGILAAERHAHEGDGIVNLRIKTYFGWFDTTLTFLTGGLITSHTILTRGDVVRLSGPPPPTFAGGDALI